MSWKPFERMSGAAARLAERVNSGVRPRSPRAQRWTFGVSALLFVAATVLAYRALPPFDEGVRWWLIAAIAVVGVPATVAVNAAEYWVSGRLVHLRIGPLDSVRVALLASAANLLPIPGAAIVRTAALKELGSTLGTALTSTATVGIAWIGTTAAIAGLVMLLDTPLVGVPTLAVGLAVLAVAVALIARRRPLAETARLSATVVVVEVGAVTVGAARLFAVLLALGHPVELAQAVALVVAGVLASATGIFPGGLGLRELLAGAISPLVGIAGALGVFATAVNRLVEYMVMLPLTLFFALRARRSGDSAGVGQAAQDPSDSDL